MSEMDRHRETFLAIARGMFMTRLHLLRLTEVVRLQIRPNEDGLMLLPTDLDEQMKKQAFDYVLTIFPEDYHIEILQQKNAWMTPQ